MAVKKEEKKKGYGDHTTIDDLLNHTYETSHKDVEGAFKDFDDFTATKHMDHLYANILAPSFDKFYSTASSELEAKFGKDGKTSVHKKENELKTILAKAMLAYLKTSRPEIHKTIMDTIKEEKKEGKEGDFYDLIAHQMDTHVLGTDKAVYRGLAKSIAANKDATINSMKVELDRRRNTTHQMAQQYLVGKKQQATIGKFEPHAISAYLKNKLIKDSNYEIADKTEFLMKDVNELLPIYYGIKKGSWADSQGKAVSHEEYGLTLKKKKEEKK